MTKQIEIGDTVKRATGASEEMEVIQITADTIICQWTDHKGELEQAAFNEWELKIVRMHDSEK
jgi:hypothetical protein